MAQLIGSQIDKVMIQNSYTEIMKVSFDFLCIDEYDSPNLAELSNKSRKEILEVTNRRHFGICGVIIPGATYPELNMSGHRIQQRTNPYRQYAPFHYSEILNKKGWKVEIYTN